MSITQPDRDRLMKLVGMLGSAHDGEKLAAMGFIERMAKQYKLTITELMAYVGKASGAPPQQQRRQPPPQWAQPPWQREPPPQPKPKPPPEPKEPVMKHNGQHGDKMLYALELAARYCLRLSSWERAFASDVANRYKFDNELSDKQRSCIMTIIEKWKATAS
jgi:hypothetical protein